MSFFLKGHERTIIAKKNILFSFLLKGGSIIIGLVLIPITIKYVNPAQYGIWLTLSSIMSWMNFFDVGLGNGLKNKLVEANALKENRSSRILVSTTYAILIIISAVLLFIFIVVNHFLNWNKILNADSSTYNFNNVALLVFVLFCIQFVVQTINTILTACHSVAKVALVLLIGQILTLIGVILLVNFTKSKPISRFRG